MQRSLNALAMVTAILLSSAVAAKAAPASGCVLGKVAELPVTMAGLKPLVPVALNGKTVLMLLDSGAFFSIVTDATAATLGLKTSEVFNMRVSGIGGTAQARRVQVKDFAIGPIVVHNTDFLVDPVALSGEAAGILGQNVLGAMDVEYDLANGVVRLFQPQKGCANASRAYWTQTYSEVSIDATSPAEPHLIGSVTINGVKLRAMFDTGAGTSVLTLKAAAKAGITPSSPGVVAAYAVGGLGGNRQVESWLAPIDSFGVGGEVIGKTRLQIGDIQLSGLSDMLVGADFFLAHRVYYAKSQRTLYFTYNGGPVFNINGPKPPAAVSDQRVVPGAENAPTDAAGFARRGAASMSRRDFASALEDFTRAIGLEPLVASHLYDRARARLANREPILAMADLAEALRLKPDDVQSLLLRGELYLSQKDEGRAKADFDAALAVAPGDPNPRLRIAGAYDRHGRFEIAISHYDRWIEQFPKHAGMAESLNGRCWTRAEWNRDLEKALGDCNAALKLRPKTSAFLDSRALVELRMGQVDRAIADYDAALALQPKAAWTLYARGLAKRAGGRKVEGDADMTAALALDQTVSARAKAIGLDPGT